MISKNHILSISTIGLMLVLVLANVRAYTISGPSMTPTYLVGDRVISNKLAYDFKVPFTERILFNIGAPNRGDTVTYFDLEKKGIAVKRVIGIPGDTIQLRDNVVYINGARLEQTVRLLDFERLIPDENRLGLLVFSEDLDGREYLITYTPHARVRPDLGKTSIPDDYYFILGDHRDNSADSRFIGLISREQIKGRVIYGARSLDSYRSQ